MNDQRQHRILQVFSFNLNDKSHPETIDISPGCFIETPQNKWVRHLYDGTRIELYSVQPCQNRSSKGKCLGCRTSNK